MKNFIAKKNFNLKYYTTLFIAGQVDYAVFPKNKEGIKEAFAFLKEKNLPLFILGRGSNVAIENEAILPYGVVLSNSLEQYEVLENEVIVEAGFSMSHLAKVLVEKYHKSSLEWAFGLPGSIGGGIFMNARVYGKEFSDIVNWVEVFNYKTFEFETISLEECEYGYKKSVFQAKPYFIYRTSLKLSSTESHQDILEQMYKNKAERERKGQFVYPSCGSLFKNDYSLGTPTGQILDSLNLRGYQKKDTKISEHHANFFVNATGNASFKEFKELIHEIEEKVKQEKKIELEREVRFFPEDLN